jgi:hypothetical protein
MRGKLIDCKTKNEQSYIYARKCVEYKSRLLRTLNRDINLGNYQKMFSIGVLE